MTHVTYTHQHLQLKSIARLKQIYSEIGCTTTVQDRRCKDSWISAIADYQSTQVQKVDEQAMPPATSWTNAQAELENFIADQAEAVAPEELTTVKINPHHFEVYAAKRLIAYISYDNSEYVTQPWVVMVNGEEKFRHFAISQCHRFIEWHHKDGTLNPPIPGETPEVPTIAEICFYEQEAFADGELIASISFDSDNHEDLYWRVIINGQEIFRDTTAPRCQSYIKQQYQQSTLPVQEPFVEPCTTGNEIMVQIAQACENFGLELLDDGIYHNDKRLVEFVYKNGVCCYIRASLKPQQIVPELLSEDLSCEEMLNQPFHLLTFEQWERLREYEPASESRELVAV
ncbi:conserved hypothetical protein (plasmid) [Trichormus variabilis ATCC 29413]|uniref:Uncharacterized protein n=2 Tax=Anabaena variabilis TaxID=264691 RepID=Q3M1V7_TRIV2|nr:MULTISPECIES: hypothetical protein [Nostocaceae]ABA25029.1 conserved hypothetical protein [Trichormus variabilis ATCC 29413]MBC1217856.1 hypothetical protein [Trichormus variabilis ARAD]MBC1259154.1 hypothetical protein [Trichormus variabilis V5]MBC1270684.1 hypothetical protein [Trichormus variabilis FSR]MBC1305516.1 hypothetical protein [Trichormus variabilis N2B]